MKKESGGLYTSDECFKMALTDAIGTACKALGMSADIHFEKDRTKYNSQENKDTTKKNPVEEAASVVVNIAPYAGMTLGAIWNKDVNFIKFLRDNPETPRKVIDAINTINSAQKR